MLIHITLKGLFSIHSNKWRQSSVMHVCVRHFVSVLPYWLTLVTVTLSCERTVMNSAVTETSPLRESAGYLSVSYCGYIPTHDTSLSMCVQTCRGESWRSDSQHQHTCPDQQQHPWAGWHRPFGLTHQAWTPQVELLSVMQRQPMVEGLCLVN